MSSPAKAPVASMTASASKPAKSPAPKRGRPASGSGGIVKKVKDAVSGKSTAGRPKKAPGERKTQPYVPTGKPRGRPKLPEDQKKVKKPYVPTGKPFRKPKKVKKAFGGKKVEA